MDTELYTYRSYCEETWNDRPLGRLWRTNAYNYLASTFRQWFHAFSTYLLVNWTLT